MLGEVQLFIEKLFFTGARQGDYVQLEPWQRRFRPPPLLFCAVLAQQRRLAIGSRQSRPRPLVLHRDRPRALQGLQVPDPGRQRHRAKRLVRRVERHKDSTFLAIRSR